MSGELMTERPGMIARPIAPKKATQCGPLAGKIALQRTVRAIVMIGRPSQATAIGRPATRRDRSGNHEPEDLLAEPEVALRRECDGERAHPDAVPRVLGRDEP